jgi:uncharacterized protein (TIGR03790 family)
MKPYYLILAALFMSIITYGQISNYEDVGVIVNDNSPVSLEIGNYFKQVRNIPEQNMIHINTVTDEVIDTLEFRNIQYQVKSYMEQNDLAGNIKYLVTTKGVPFDIAVDSCHVGSPNHSFVYCSSVESELTLLFSADSTEILSSNMMQNPYFGSATHHNQNPTDLMLVSRLDGKTVEDVFNLIDKSGPGTYVNKELGKYVFDVSYIEESQPTYEVFKGLMQPAIDTLDNYGWNTIFDGNYEPPTNIDHVLGFVGCIWSTNPAPLNFSWENGSFAEMIVVPPEFTFYDSLNTLENYLLADIIGEGCPAGSGYIHATFASQLTDYGIFFSRYTDPRNEPYNLAESYYMATKTLSWMNILVGDPKTTINTLGAGGINEIQHLSLLNLYPNPAEDFVNLSMMASRNTSISLEIYDQTGRMYFTKGDRLTKGRNEIAINISKLNPGLYFFRLTDEFTGSIVSKKLLVR